MISSNICCFSGTAFTSSAVKGNSRPPVSTICALSFFFKVWLVRFVCRGIFRYVIGELHNKHGSIEGTQQREFKVFMNEREREGCRNRNHEESLEAKLKLVLRKDMDDFLKKSTHLWIAC
jgi:hypothetical protein